MKCPKCKHIQEGTVECESCKIVFHKYLDYINKKHQKAILEYENGSLNDALEKLISIQNALPDDLNFVKNCKQHIFKIKITAFTNHLIKGEISSALEVLVQIKNDYDEHDDIIFHEYERAIGVMYDTANGLFVSGNYSDASLLFEVLKNEKLIKQHNEINNKSLYFLNKIKSFSTSNNPDKLDNNLDSISNTNNSDLLNFKQMSKNRFAAQDDDQILSEFNENNKSDPAFKFIVIKRLSLVSVVLLLFISFYLHWTEEQKLKEISLSIVNTTNTKFSDFGRVTTEVVADLEDRINDNKRNIEGIQSTIQKMIPVLENCNNNAHSHNSSYSDKRLKEDIAPVKTTLDKLVRLQPYSFKYKYSDYNIELDDKYHYGFLAHEVEEIFPILVSEDKSGYKKVDYLEAVPLLVGALHEQNEKILKLETELADLQMKLNQ